MKKFKKVLALIISFATLFSSVPIPNFAAGDGKSFQALTYTSYVSNDALYLPGHNTNTEMPQSEDLVVLNDTIPITLYNMPVQFMGGRIDITNYVSIAKPSSLSMTFSVGAPNPLPGTHIVLYWRSGVENTYSKSYPLADQSNVIASYEIVAGANTITISGATLDKLFDAFNSGKTVSITSTGDMTNWVSIEGLSFNTHNIFSNDTSVTSPDGSFTVDTQAATISSGTTKLTSAVNVGTLKSKLQTHVAATSKVTKATVAGEVAFNDAAAEADIVPVAGDMFYVVKAESGATKAYSLRLATNNDDLATKPTHYTVSAGSIVANTTPITTDVEVSTLLGNLTKHAAADWLVAPDTSTFANEAALKAEIASRTVLSKAGTDKLANGDKVWTVSEAGTVRSYVITVTATPPAATPAHTVTATIAPGNKVAGVRFPVTFTVKKSDGSTDTSFTGTKNVAVSSIGLVTSIGTRGSFNGISLSADAESTSQTIAVVFTNGVAHPELSIDKAGTRRVVFSVATVATPSVTTSNITIVAGTPFNLVQNQPLAAPAVNGGQFATQPILQLNDIFGNFASGDNTTVVRVEKAALNVGSWTLTGTKSVTAVGGLVTFTDLGATNTASVPVELTYYIGGTTMMNSNTVTLPTAPDVTISNLDLTTLVPTPVAGATKVTSFDTPQYTATVDWTNVDIGAPAPAIFKYNELYEARVGITPKAGYTVTGVLSNSFVHTGSTSVLNAANPISIRVRFPRTPDITPPAFAVNYPTVNAVTHEAARFNYNINEVGTVEFTTKLASAPAPDNAAFDTLKTSVPVSSAQINAARSIMIGSLAPLTEYKLYYRAVDNALNVTNINSVTFTTTAAPITPAHSVVASIAANPMIAGADTTLTLTVKKSDGTTDTSFSGGLSVPVSGVSAAPNGSYGSINGVALTASSVTGQAINSWFTDGVFTAPIKLNKAGTQNLTFSVLGVTNPTASTGNITVSPNDPAALKVLQHAADPLTNGGLLATQPVVALVDAYGNVMTNDSISSITAYIDNDPRWTLGGEANKPLINGVATFTDLSATSALGINAILNYRWSVLPHTKSSTFNIPAPVVIPAQTVAVTGGANMIAGPITNLTFTVKKSDNTTDTTFNGNKTVTAVFTQQSASGAIGQFAGHSFNSAAELASQTFTVNFSNGIATVPLRLTKAGTQAMKFSVTGVATAETNNLNVTVAPNSASRLLLHRDVAAPTTPNGNFAQQPIVYILDMYDNLCTNDNTFQVTASKQDTGTWTLTGTKTATAVAGVVTFSDLGTQNTSAVTGAKLSFDGPTMLGFVPIKSAAVNLSIAAPPTPGGGSGSGSSSGSSGGSSGGGSPTLPTQPINTPHNAPVVISTQNRPIDVIVNGVTKQAGTLTTSLTNGGLQTATVSVSSSGVTEQLNTPVTNGKPSVIVTVPQMTGTGSQSVYSAEVTSSSANAMAGASASLAVNTPLSTVTLTSQAIENITEAIDRLSGAGATQARLVVGTASAPISSRPATLASQPLTSVLGTPVSYTTEVVTGETRIQLSDYNTFVPRTVNFDSATITKLTQSGAVSLGGSGVVQGTQGVVYINGSAYPVPTMRTPNGATINSITNSIYDLIVYSKSFTDTKGHKYDAAITNMASRLIVTGESADRFNPDAKVTRAEFATMVTRALGLYRGEMGNAKFKDLTKINGLNVGITVAADRGLVTGVSQNTFAPNDNITAKDMSQILFNIVKKYGDTSTFATKASELKTTGYAKEAVAFTTKAGLLEVKSADKEMTRAEAAFAIEQMLEGMNLIDKR